jgi:hypothetical protein
MPRGSYRCQPVASSISICCKIRLGCVSNLEEAAQSVEPLGFSVAIQGSLTLGLQTPGYSLPALRAWASPLIDWPALRACDRPPERIYG